MQINFEMIYSNYALYVIFVHILSAVIWVGGMIVVKLAIHPALHKIEDENIRIKTSLKTMGNLFNLAFPFVVLSLLTALVFLLGAKFSGWIVYAKEGIWTVMTINFLYMYIQRLRASFAYKKGDLDRVKNLVRFIPTRLLPLNILLGIAAIFLGVMFRGL